MSRTNLFVFLDDKVDLTKLWHWKVAQLRDYSVMKESHIIDF